MGNLIDKYYLKKHSNCIDCQYHLIRKDPNPIDAYWCNNVKVMCAVNMRDVITDCHPAEVRKECTVPIWCPILLIEHPMEEKEVMDEGQRIIWGI